MSTKAILVFCAQALFVQSALSQCTSCAAVAAEPRLTAPAGLAASYGFDAVYGLAGPTIDAPYSLSAPAWSIPYDMAAPCAWAAPAMDFTPTSGGGLPVSSSSTIAPVGLSVISENAYEGILFATGELPFVGTVAVEGVVPSAGVGVVNHACGNGVNAMVSESAAFAPDYAGAAYTPAGVYGPTAAIAPATAIAPGCGAPGFGAPGLGFRAGWAGTGCGCAL